MIFKVGQRVILKFPAGDHMAEAWDGVRGVVFTEDDLAFSMRVDKASNNIGYWGEHASFDNRNARLIDPASPLEALIETYILQEFKELGIS